jgi:hypothetical protein
MIPDCCLALLAALGDFATDVAATFSKTSLGPNPWSDKALCNAVCIAPHVYRAAGLCNGTLTSMFRCPAVNAKAGGERDSRHLDGIAADLAPGAPWTVESAFLLIAARARRGELGPVRTVIQEPSIVHVDWFAATEAKHPPNFFRQVVNSAGAVDYIRVEV